MQLDNEIARDRILKSLVISKYVQGEERGQVHEGIINRLPTAKYQLSVQTLPEFANIDTDQEAFILF